MLFLFFGCGDLVASPLRDLTAMNTISCRWLAKTRFFDAGLALAMHSQAGEVNIWTLCAC
jgi:hypothetical protein